jgi:hypothetical protein
MKKLLPSALLALAASAFVTAESFAGNFGLFPCSSCCGCGAKFCVRQYNAFSPVCSGTIYCDGIMPIASGLANGGYGGYGGCAGGMCPGGACGLNYMGFMSGPGCPDGGCLGSLPMSEEATPGTTAPPSANPVATPEPLPSNPSGPTSQTLSDRPIQSTSYRPVYNYPNPLMMQAQPQIMVAPSYWSK